MGARGVGLGRGGKMICLGRSRGIIGLAEGLRRQELCRLLLVVERELGPAKRAGAGAG